LRPNESSVSCSVSASAIPAKQQQWVRKRWRRRRITQKAQQQHPNRAKLPSYWWSLRLRCICESHGDGLGHEY